MPTTPECAKEQMNMGLNGYAQSFVNERTLPVANNETCNLIINTQQLTETRF